MANAEFGEANTTGVVRSLGLVENVRRQWALHEDAVLATQLQDSEFASKYKRNCAERQLARCDVPLARHEQTQEEVELQRRQMEELEKTRLVIEDDGAIARQLQSEEMVRKNQERLRQEQKDQDLARELQHKERLRYELRKQEKELRRHRKKLEIDLQRQAAEINVADAGDSLFLADSLAVQSFSGQGDHKTTGYRHSKSDSGLKSTSDFYDEPPDIINPEQLQQQQDVELAKRLQEQEDQSIESSSNDRMREIEIRDAELARLMQEEEELKQKRRLAQRSSRYPRQVSEPVHHYSNQQSDRSGSKNHSSQPSYTLSDGTVTHFNPSYRSMDSPPPLVCSSVSEGTDSTTSSHLPSSSYATRPLPATPVLSNSDSDPCSQLKHPFRKSLGNALDQDFVLQTEPGVGPANNAKCAAEKCVDERRRVQTVGDTEGHYNVARHEPNGDNWFEPRHSKSRARSKERQESSIKSRVRSSSRSRSDRCTDQISNEVAVNYDIRSSGPACENVFCAIDPTCGRSSESTPLQSVLPVDVNISRRRAPIVLEDSYCDLDEVQTSVRDMNVGIVPSQRRSSNKEAAVRGSSNCKQQ